MRIISPFKDYYDSALAYGSEPNLVYKRTPKVAMIDLFEFNLPHLGSAINSKEMAYPHLVFFCGKIFPLVSPKKILEEYDELLMGGNRSDLVYSAEQIKGLNPKGHVIFGFDEEENVDAFLARMETISNTPVDLRIHQIFEAPVLLTTAPGWQLRSKHVVPILINPRLRNLKFQSLYDPFSCFQEISMFLANELAPPDIAPLRTGDDQTIVRAKGFDDQSFRTAAPGHKKLNRQANRKRKSQSD